MNLYFFHSNQQQLSNHGILKILLIGIIFGKQSKLITLFMMIMHSGSNLCIIFLNYQKNNNNI